MYIYIYVYMYIYIYIYIHIHMLIYTTITKTIFIFPELPLVQEGPTLDLSSQASDVATLEETFRDGQVFQPMMGIRLHKWDPQNGSKWSVYNENSYQHG